MEVELNDHKLLEAVATKLAEPLRDGLAEIHGNTLRVTEKGRPFLRILCTALDGYGEKENSQQPVFSKTI